MAAEIVICDIVGGDTENIQCRPMDELRSMVLEQTGDSPNLVGLMTESSPANPEASLPVYTHIPGVTPHPLGDPRGHSFGQVHAPCPTPDWATISSCELFQCGRRLFNAGYYWEAHEAWEGVWIAAGRTGLVADYVKGLIKLAAAGVKVREGSTVGAQRHLARATELFLLTVSRLPQPTDDLDRLLALVRSLQQSLPATPDSNGGRPVAILGQI